ncbi:flagellar filament capping protein FliD [Pseudarthrobacter sp. NPDC092424]|uniref:flagellar filament capping protein FliD n=1 Tax=Pseudarthrobacter sp. NPDC092424 TaxID=3364415 RepID=UPI003820FDD6
MGIALPGLATGMDTTGLISSLMRIEAIPQTLLKNKVSASQSMVTSLQTLNAKIASLAELSKATAKTGALDLFVATSSSEGVTAKAGAGATAGSVDFTVDRLAQAHAGVTASMTVWPNDPPVLTFVGADGTRTEVAAASTSLDDVVSAVNASATAGVTAMKVSTGNGEYRLQLTSKTSGAAGSFTAYRGNTADLDAGTATDLFAEPGAAVITTGQDAQVTLWAGTGAAQAITSSSNTFTGLLPGVDVTLTSVPTAPVTVTVAGDNEQITKKAEDLVSALNGIFAYIKSNSAVTPATGSAGTKAGNFTGDSTVRDANQRLLAAASQPVGGRSPAEIGIAITKDGNFTFDAAKFSAALAADPALVESTLQTIAGRVETAATVTSDRYKGLITASINGRQSVVKNLQDQILKWDDRLAAREETLKRIYSGLEVQISRMNSQSTWLASQIATLPQGDQGS